MLTLHVCCAATLALHLNVMIAIYIYRYILDYRIQVWNGSSVVLLPDMGFKCETTKPRRFERGVNAAPRDPLASQPGRSKCEIKKLNTFKNTFKIIQTTHMIYGYTDIECKLSKLSGQIQWKRRSVEHYKTISNWDMSDMSLYISILKFHLASASDRILAFGTFAGQNSSSSTSNIKQIKLREV